MVSDKRNTKREIWEISCRQAVIKKNMTVGAELTDIKKV